MPRSTLIPERRLRPANRSSGTSVLRGQGEATACRAERGTATRWAAWLRASSRLRVGFAPAGQSRRHANSSLRAVTESVATPPPAKLRYVARPLLDLRVMNPNGIVYIN